MIHCGSQYGSKVIIASYYFHHGCDIHCYSELGYKIRSEILYTVERLAS